MRSVLVFVAFLLLASSQAAGAFIIDDFDSDVRLDFPEQHREWSPVIRNNGAWEEYGAFVSSSQTRPHGFLDVNGVIPSAAVFGISQLNHSRPNGLYTGPSVEFAYFNLTDGVDFTAGGTANAIIIDVIALETSYTREVLNRKPGGFRIDVRSDVDGVQYRGLASHLRYDAGAHSVVVPFDSFFPTRGQGPIDFSHIESVRFYYELTAFDSTLPEDTSLYVALDRIRTGMVPEPEGGIELLVLLLLIVNFKRKRP